MFVGRVGGRKAAVMGMADDLAASPYFWSQNLKFLQ